MCCGCQKSQRHKRGLWDPAWACRALAPRPVGWAGLSARAGGPSQANPESANSLLAAEGHWRQAVPCGLRVRIFLILLEICPWLQNGYSTSKNHVFTQQPPEQKRRAEEKILDAHCWLVLCLVNQTSHTQGTRLQQRHWPSSIQLGPWQRERGPAGG